MRGERAGCVTFLFLTIAQKTGFFRAADFALVCAPSIAVLVGVLIASWLSPPCDDVIFHV
jgi:hypothetical protein